ncbi:MAG: VWA domain-containing protein [Oscillospiraceae bacterium]|nr:VWA domain-containing protein [Oscillospiraceae bacterium]
MIEEKIKRWRLILGNSVQNKFSDMNPGFKLDERGTIMDNALAAIYDDTKSQDGSGKKTAGLGPSAPNLAKWLTDIRDLFPEDVVSVIQADAIERKGLKQLLLEPETLKNIKPDISMVGTLLALKGQIPESSKESARKLIRAVVDDIMDRLESDIRRSVTGAIHKNGHTPIPNLPGMDWKRVIEKNLKNYDVERKRIIPDKFYFFERTTKSKQWKVIIDIDQSGSMADSIIYSSVMSCIFASMPVLDTKVVAFDTNVVDLTEACHTDPVDMLFGIQLGGGTDINKSVEYCSQFVEEPSKTMFILISDLYEGGVEAGLIKKLTALYESGVKVLVLVALSDRGVPAYDERLAKKIANIGIPSFGCTPDRLPELIEGALKGFNLMELSKRITETKKK